MRREDLVGKKFGHLLVTGEDEAKHGKHRYWLCQCDCGNICSVPGTHLKTGHTKSCGCSRKKQRVHGWLDLTGERYGRLVVLGPWEGETPDSGVVKDGSVKQEGAGEKTAAERWLCRCDCGNLCVCQKESLRTGKTKSCGCLREEQRKVNMQSAIHFTDNTCLERIASRKNASNNTSGRRGVYLRKNGTWRASIGFQGKVYNLGTFKDYEEAVRARAEAEKKYYDAFLEIYQSKQEKTK